MKNKHLLPSFTILETIIGMVVMSIIISLVFYIFQAMTQTFELYSQTKIMNGNYLYADNQLKTDVFNSLSMEKQANNAFILRLKNNDSVRFYVVNHTLHRVHHNIDEPYEVNISYYNFKEIQNKIPAIRIVFSIFEESIQAVYYKDYGCHKAINDFAAKHEIH